MEDHSNVASHDVVTHKAIHSCLRIKNVLVDDVGLSACVGIGNSASVRETSGKIGVGGQSKGKEGR